MKIECIYTFVKSEQAIKLIAIEPDNLKSNEDLSKHLISDLTDSEKCELIKISCCIISNRIEEVPEWFKSCNGKFWFKNGELD